jgi:hypothetical protein
MKAKLICLEENLYKIGYKLDMKVIKKNVPSIFLNTYSNLYYKCQYNLYITFIDIDFFQLNMAKLGPFSS